MDLGSVIRILEHQYEGSARPAEEEEATAPRVWGLLDVALSFRVFTFFKVRENKGKQQHSGRMRPLEISFIFHEYESRPGQIVTKTKRAREKREPNIATTPSTFVMQSIFFRKSGKKRLVKIPKMVTLLVKKWYLPLCNHLQ